MLMGILCPVILPATCIVPPRNTKFAQRRAVGSELVGHDGGWSDALLLQEFSHQLERRLAVSPWLNEDVQDLAFAVHGTPDVQLSAVDGDEHFVEMPPPVRPRPSSSQLARNDPAEKPSGGPSRRTHRCHARRAYPRRRGSSERSGNRARRPAG